MLVVRPKPPKPVPNVGADVVEVPSLKPPPKPKPELPVVVVD